MNISLSISIVDIFYYHEPSQAYSSRRLCGQADLWTGRRQTRRDREESYAATARKLPSAVAYQVSQ